MERSKAFKDGRLVGNKLLSLFGDLGLELDLGEPMVDEVENTLSQIWSHSSSDSPEPRLVGFLSQILRSGSCDATVLNIWGLDQFLYEQTDVAPVANMSTESGIFAFADWTGESDGDCWCFDIPYSCIRCIPVGAGEADADQSRLQSYGVFPNFHHFVAYLRCEAELRGWLKENG